MDFVFPKLLTVEVTQKDIDRGERCNSRRCPVARAVWRYMMGLGMPPRLMISVSRFGLYFASPTSGECRATYVPDQGAADFIGRYDGKKKGNPFTAIYQRRR